MPNLSNPDAAFSTQVKAKLQQVIAGNEGNDDGPTLLDKMEPASEVDFEITVGPDINWVDQIKQGLLVIVPEGAILSQVGVEVTEVSTLLDLCLAAPEQGLNFVRVNRALFPYLRVLTEETAGFSVCRMSDAPGSVSPLPAEWVLAVDRLHLLEYQWIMRKVRHSLANERKDQSAKAKVGTDDAPPRDLETMMKAGEKRRGITKPGEFNEGTINQNKQLEEDDPDAEHGGNG